MEPAVNLTLPGIGHKAEAESYIREFIERGDEVHGSGSLDRFLRESTYETWLEKLKSDMDIANMPVGRVAALTYFCVRERDQRIVGMVNIRLMSSDLILTEAGHVGYSVRPSERRKGYATLMLREAVRVCRAVGIGDVIVCCSQGNAASAGTILNCGGVLDAVFHSLRYNEVIERYRIPARA